MRRLVLVLLVTILLAAVEAVSAEDWAMIAKDPSHASSVPQGPAAPLKRAWVAKSDDPDGSFTTWPIASGEVVYARQAGGVLAAVASTGATKWRNDTHGAKQITPALDAARLYVPLPSRQLVALDREGGKEVWRIDIGETGLADPSPTLLGDRLFFGLPDDNAFYSVDVGDGRIVWKKTLELRPDSVPASAEGILVFTAQDLNSRRVDVHAVEAVNGAEVWRIQNRLGMSSPSILGGQVILGGGDFFAYALDLKTGKEIWKSQVEGKFSVRNMPALAFGDVFLADRIGNIYRLDGETGKRKWIFRDTEGTMDQSFPVIAGKTLFIGSSAGNLYALDTETGRLLWTDHVDGIVLSGAADSERFYFGVKLGKDEGLHAYEHDPQGKLIEPSRGSREFEPLIGGLILVALVFGAILVFTRIRRRRERETAAP